MKRSPGINEREPAAIWARRMSADHCPNVPDRPSTATVGGGFPVAAHCIECRAGRLDRRGVTQQLRRPRLAQVTQQDRGALSEPWFVWPRASFGELPLCGATIVPGFGEDDVIVEQREGVESSTPTARPAAPRP